MSAAYTPSMSPYMGRRLDRAWQFGYEAGVEDGRREWRRLAIVSVAFAAFTLWRRPAIRRHTHLIPWAMVCSLVALAMVLAITPVVLGALALRAGVRHYRELPPRPPRRRPDRPAGCVVGGAAPPGGLNEWEPF